METVEKVVDAFHKGMEASHQANHAISWAMEGLNKIADLFRFQNIEIETLLHLGPIVKKKDDVEVPF